MLVNNLFGVIIFCGSFIFLGPFISGGKKLLESEYLGMKRNLGECETFGDQHYYGTLLRNIIFGGSPPLYVWSACIIWEASDTRPCILFLVNL